MKIETKYNLYDIVYTMLDNKISEMFITSIYIKYDIQDSKTINTYKLRYKSGDVDVERREELLFLTKELLVESLLKK